MKFIKDQADQVTFQRRRPTDSLRWNGQKGTVLVGLLAFLAITLYATVSSYAANWAGMGSGMNGGVYALTLDGVGNLYAGGDFTNAGGVAANRIAKWDGNSWTNLGSGIDGYVWALEFDGSGNLYACGMFSHAGGVSANSVAKWNGSGWTNLGSGMDSFVVTVLSLACDGSGNLYACGAFTHAGGVAANRIAKWNGSAWLALGSGLGDYGYSLAVTGTYVYAGGQFTNAGGVAANHVAEWNDLWAEAVDAGGGWESLSWFGRFLDDENGWIYHAELGWMYSVGTSTDSIWLWSPARHWLWTSDSLFPFLWSNDLQAWLWYCVGSANGSSGWFYNFGAHQWQWL